MIRPYIFRICAALPGHTPVELARFSRKYAQADWDFFTRDLAPEWECWTEHTLDDRDCLSERPKVRDAHTPGPSRRPPLYPTAQELEIIRHEP